MDRGRVNIQELYTSIRVPTTPLDEEGLKKRNGVRMTHHVREIGR
jgi:hypothetical protein